MRRQNVFVWGLAWAAIVLAPVAARAVVVTPIDGNYDVWIRQNSAGTVYQNDLMSTQSGSDTRYGVVQFNISGVAQPINSAFFELWNQNNSAVTLAPAYWVNSSVQSTDLSQFNWAEYELFVQGMETQFEQLGSGDFPANTPAPSTYGATALSSANDAAVLETIRQGDGIITVIFKATSGRRDWGDTEFSGTPVRLVINESQPIFGDLDGDFDIDTDDYALLTSADNWLKAAPGPGQGVDLTGDAFVNLADFTLFKQLYNDFNGGGAQSIPEPGTWALAALGAMTLGVVHRRRRQRS